LFSSKKCGKSSRVLESLEEKQGFSKGKIIKENWD